MLSKDKVGSPLGRIFRRAQTRFCWKHYRYTGIFDPGLAAAGWAALSLEIPASPPWLQLHTPPLQFPAVVFSCLTSQPAPPCTSGHEDKEQEISVGSSVSTECTHTRPAGTERHICSRGCGSKSLQVSCLLCFFSHELESFVPDDT